MARGKNDEKNVVEASSAGPDGSYAVAEALTFVPGVKLDDDTNNGRCLVRL